MRHSWKLGAAVIAAVAILTGCTSNHPKPDPPISIGNSNPFPVTSTTTSSPATPQDLAKAQAVALARKYYVTSDTLSMQAGGSLLPLNDVAMGTLLTALNRSYFKYRAQGAIQKGRAVVVSAKAVSFNPTYLPNMKPRQLPTVKVTTCVDVRGVQARDPSGKSLIAPNRKPFHLGSLEVSNFKYPDAAGWRVASETNQGVNSCAGS
jgi:hypothetical protein